VIGVPGASGDLDVHGERRGVGVSELGGRVVVGEVVDHLLDADRVLRGERVLGHEEAADVGVGGRVHVRGEGGQGLGGGHLERVVLNLGVLLGAGRLGGWLLGLCHLGELILDLPQPKGEAGLLGSGCPLPGLGIGGHWRGCPACLGGRIDDKAFGLFRREVVDGCRLAQPLGPGPPRATKFAFRLSLLGLLREQSLSAECVGTCGGRSLDPPRFSQGHGVEVSIAVVGLAHALLAHRLVPALRRDHTAQRRGVLLGRVGLASPGHAARGPEREGPLGLGRLRSNQDGTARSRRGLASSEREVVIRKARGRLRRLHHLLACIGRRLLEQDGSGRCRAFTVQRHIRGDPARLRCWRRGRRGRIGEIRSHRSRGWCPRGGTRRGWGVHRDGALSHLRRAPGRDDHPGRREPEPHQRGRRHAITRPSRPGP